MSRKNRNKKAARRKKVPTKPKKGTSPVPDTPEAQPVAEHQAEVIREEEPSGGGAMIGMRQMISGAAPVKEGFFSKRRTLAEWLLWFGGAIGLYYLVRSLMGE